VHHKASCEPSDILAMISRKSALAEKTLETLISGELFHKRFSNKTLGGEPI